MQKAYLGFILLIVLGTACRQVRKEPIAPDDPGVRADDLSNRQVLCFGEDRDGYIWIGTARGLNKYNGYQYLQYLHSDKDSASLSNNCILNIFTGSGGDMWITTRFGINRLNDKEEFIRVPVESSSKNILHIAETDNRRLFINTAVNICEYDTTENRFVNRIQMPDNGIMANRMIVDKKNRIWCIGYERVECYDITDFNRIAAFRLNGKIHEVYHLSNGEIWLCVGNKLMVLDTKNMQFIQPPPAIRNHPALSAAVITLIHTFDTGSILFQTQRHGCFLYNTYSGRILHQSDSDFPFKVPDNTITTFFTDSNHNLWMGSYDQGFFVHYHNKQQFNP